MIFINLLFWLNLALLLAHELDAVQRKEWRLFVFLNRLDDERAHQLFALLHVPLFIIIFWFLSRPNQPVYFWFQLAIDAFLVVHLGLHLLFRSHPANTFANVFSMRLIAGMALLGLIHAGLLLTGITTPATSEPVTLPTYLPAPPSAPVSAESPAAANVLALLSSTLTPLPPLPSPIATTPALASPAATFTAMSPPMLCDWTTANPNPCRMKTSCLRVICVRWLLNIGHTAR